MIMDPHDWVTSDGTFTRYSDCRLAFDLSDLSRERHLLWILVWMPAQCSLQTRQDYVIKINTRMSLIHSKASRVSSYQSISFLTSSNITGPVANQGTFLYAWRISSLLADGSSPSKL